jgi:hypothetical protein
VNRFKNKKLSLIRRITVTEELGKIEKPEAAAFSGKRKLYVVPLLYGWPEAEKEYTALFERYWKDIEGQLKHLGERIGAIKHIYHEGIDESGEAALATLEHYNPASHRIARAMMRSGADLTRIEDRELIAESLDWERFVMLGFTSAKVARTASEHYRNAMKNRYDHFVKRIDESLLPDEAGVLFVREGHPIQFPKEIEVFSVFPPSLDEIHRYLRNRPPEAAEPEGSAEPEPPPTESAANNSMPAADETGN